MVHFSLKHTQMRVHSDSENSVLEAPQKRVMIMNSLKENNFNSQVKELHEIGNLLMLNFVGSNDMNHSP